MDRPAPNGINDLAYQLLDRREELRAALNKSSRGSLVARLEFPSARLVAVDKAFRAIVSGAKPEELVEAMSPEPLRRYKNEAWNTPGLEEALQAERAWIREAAQILAEAVPAI